MKFHLILWKFFFSFQTIWTGGIADLIDYGVRLYPDDKLGKSQANDNFIDGWIHLRDAVIYGGEVFVADELHKGILLRNRSGSIVVSRVNVHSEVHTPFRVGFNNVPGPIAVNFCSSKSLSMMKAECTDRILEPSFFFGLVAYPFYGHLLFNVHSNLMHTIKSQRHQFGRVRIYGAKDGKNPHLLSLDKETELLQLSRFYPIMFGMLSVNQSVYSWPFVLQQSLHRTSGGGKLLTAHKPRTFCFDEVTLGMTSEWDHYNYSTSASSWRQYRSAVEEFASLCNLSTGNSGTKNSNSCSATIISRDSRSIVNEQAVANVLQSEFGCITTVVRLEKLHFLEQIRLMRQTTLLIGMDGTGLLNAAFMSPPAGVVSVMMYRLREITPHKGHNFRNLIEKMGLCWSDIEVKHANQSFVPIARNPFNRTVDDLLVELNSLSVRNATARKHFASKLHEVLMLQDSVLDLDEVRNAVRISLACIRNNSEREII